ncbi:MAG: helix-turn-helix domain-containing protein [Halobacteriales archaeon]
MPQAKLTLTLPEGVWIGEISQSYPDACFRILAAIPGDNDGVGLLEITAADLAAVLRDMEGTSEVTEIELFRRTEETVLLQFETTEPLLLAPMQGSGVPIEMPFDIVDGEASWEVTAPRERLSALTEQLDAFGIKFNVEYIRGEFAAEQFLTDQQRQLVDAAIEAGYYDTPRACSLTGLAEEVGIAKSTCSETLHRAEGKIIKRHMEETAGASLSS